MHMALGLRVLAIEFLGVRERTGAAVSACIGVGFAFGLSFLLNAS
jgi:fumarate reductase subunit D